MARERQEWGSRLGVILAVAGSAVGLGNFLRFPGNAASNGGGAFMIPYFIALLILGIPIGWAEWTMGKYGGRKGFHSAPAILGVFGKGTFGRAFGLIGVLIPLGVSFYYVLVESWCLSYFFDFVTGGIGIDAAAPVEAQVQVSGDYFAYTTGSEFDGVVAQGGIHQSVVFWVITFGLNAWFVYRGLTKGIETFCRWAMPVMVLCGLAILVRVLTLGTPDPAQPEQSVWNGLGFMWNPDFQALKKPSVWLAAAGQIFFSLSVGFGVIINYASYMRRKDDVVLSGLTSTATNEFFEVVLGGLITIPAAVAFLGIAMTQGSMGSSFSLGFNTLPVVFAHMPMGNLFGALFFLVLFLAAITSSLSMLFPTMAFVEEALGVNRKTSTTIVVTTSLVGSFFVLWFSKNSVALATIDDWVGTVGIYVLATVQIICFGWVFGIDKGLAIANEGASVRIPRIFRFIIKYVTPTYLLVIFVYFCIYDLPGKVEGVKASPVAQYTLAMVGLVIVGLIALLAVGVKRWRAEGLDVDGRLPADDEAALANADAYHGGPR